MVLLSDVRQILFQIFHKWPNRQLSQTTIKPLINQLNYPKIEISQSEQLFPGNLCNLGLNSLIRHKRPCMIRCGNVTSCGKWSSGPWVRPVHRGEVSLVSWFMIQFCFLFLKWPSCANFTIDTCVFIKMFCRMFGIFWFHLPNVWEAASVITSPFKDFFGFERESMKFI